MAHACRDRDSELLSAASAAAASSDDVCDSMVSAIIYRVCGGTVLCWGRVSSVWSLTVSLVDQKKAADSTYPMGIDK